MRFDFTQEELLEANKRPKNFEYKTLPKGNYKFTVLDCDTNAISKAGNGMLKYTLNIEHEGLNYKIFGQLMYPQPKVTTGSEEIQENNRKARYAQINQLDGFCNCLGISSFRSKKEINNEDVLNKTGIAAIIEDEYNGKKNNKVHYFIGKASKTVVANSDRFDAGKPALETMRDEMDDNSDIIF